MQPYPRHRSGIRYVPRRESGFEIAFRNRDSLDCLPTPVSQLNSASAGGTAPAHVRGWRTDYDYLYMVGDQTAGVPDHLTNMMRSRRFTLYAIGK